MARFSAARSAPAVRRRPRRCAPPGSRARRRRTRWRSRRLIEILQHARALAAAGRTTRSRCWASADRSPISRSASRGRNASIARDSMKPEPGMFSTDDAAGADRVDQARHAEPRGGVELQRVDPFGVDLPPDHVGALQAGDGAHDRRAGPRRRRDRRPRPAGSRDSGRDRRARNRSRCRGRASGCRCAARLRSPAAFMPARRSRKNGATRSTFIWL